MKKKYYSILISMLLSICFTFSGCGEEEPEKYIEMSERLNQKGTYIIEELGFTDPDTSIYKEAGNDVLLYPREYVLSGDTVFRIVETCEEEYQNPRIFLQKLEAPYKEWKVAAIDSVFTENDKEYRVSDYLYAQGHPIYAIMNEYHEETNAFDYYLANCNEEGEVERILGAIPKEIDPSTSFHLQAEDLTHIYAYNSIDGDHRVIILSPEMQAIKEVKSLNNIYGVLSDVKNDIIYLNQHDSKGFCIYDLDNELIVQDSEKLNSYFYQADVLSDGTIMVCDSQKLWQCKKGETPKLLCDFLLNNYIFGEIYDLEVQEDDTALILLQYEGKIGLVKVSNNTQEAQTEKQEIIIAFGYPHMAITSSIGRFNRQSDKYVITAITKDENETMEDYNRAIQFEISTGKGPDILADDFLYMGTEGYMQNGYFASLDDVLDSMEPYLVSAFEGGKSEGVLYGMPYDFRLRLATYSQDFTKGREYWTLPDFMKAVEAVEPKAIMKGFNAYHIILYFGLYDNSNKEFIDWEKGESHLTEKPFLDLVKFAEKYGENSDISDLEEGRALEEGMTISSFTDVCQLRKFAEMEACFKGKPAYTGFPRTDEKGVYILSRYLYVNSSSEQIEGAKEFLRFLLSEEEQKRFLNVNHIGVGSRAEIPVNLSAIDYLIEMENNLAREEKDVKFYSELASYSRTGLNEEQAEEFKELVKNAVPCTFYASGIADMVCEELEYYFNGDKTLEEAVTILDKRVQLYMDEGIK